MILISIFNLSNSFIIYPLNEIGQYHKLEIEENKEYYFFSSIINAEINEPISYYISEEIKYFKISYTFLETENDTDITEENIINYSFNETLGKLDYKNYFKTIFKTNNKQKGLLLKLKIIDYEKLDFIISKINLTIIGPKNMTIFIRENQDNYFFINLSPILNLYDIFIFSSNGTNRIKQYYLNEDTISNEKENKGFILLNDNCKEESKFINIQTEKNEEVILNIKYLPKKKLTIINNHKIDVVIPIELSYLNSSFNEVYYLFNSSGNENVFNEIYGEFEAYYFNLEKIFNLDDIFENNIAEKRIYNGDLIETLHFTLFYIKSVDNKPTLLELISINIFSVVCLSNYGKNDTYYFYASNNFWNQEIWNQDAFNTSLSIEYLGCKLEENQSIDIYLGEYNITFTKNFKKKYFENIYLPYGHYLFFTPKDCVLKVKLGGEENENTLIYTLNEINNIKIESENKYIIFTYPKIEENNHYLLEFYYNDNQIYPFCYSFYDDIDEEFYVKNDYINNTYFIGSSYEIKMNPYKVFETENNITFLIICQTSRDIKSFNIKTIKKDKGILNKVFHIKKYTEYTFPEITKESIILIQQINSLSNNIHSSFSISSYERNINEEFSIFKGYIGSIPKLMNKGEEDIYIKINYIDDLLDYSNIIDYNKIFQSSIKNFNISFDSKGIFKFIIEPFIINEDIKYIIHLFNKSSGIKDNKGSLNNYYEEIFENFGDLSINQTFIKKSSEIFEYDFNVGKIDLSYNRFFVIGIDLKTGFIHKYKIKEYNYKYEDNNEDNKEEGGIKTWLLILIIVLSAIILILIVFFIVKAIRRKNSIEEKNNNISGRLMDES